MPARERWLWLVPLVLVAFAYRDALGFELVGDARFLIVENRYLDGLRHLWPNLTHDYFWSSSGASIPYWRPLTKASWLLEAAAFGRRAPVFFAAQLAWLLAGVAGVELLARRLGARPFWAMLAALVFGLHPIAVEPACLVMARSDVACAASSIWALVFFHFYRERSGAGWLGAHAAAVALALASKEAAVVLAPLVVFWIILDGDFARGRRAKLWAAAPALALAAIYLVLRARVLAGTAPPRLALSPLRWFAGLGVYLGALLPLRLESPVRNLSWAEAAAAGSLARSALAAFVLGAAIFFALRARARGALVLIAAVLASLLPVLLVEQIHVPAAEGKIPLADRWLLQAVAFSSVLYALAAQRVPSLRARRAIAAAMLLWALGAIVVARPAHAYYRDEAGLLDLEDRHYDDTPERFRTVEDRCRAADRQIVRALQQRDADTALGLQGARPAECATSAGQRFNLLSALVQARRFGEARPLVAALLGAPDLDARMRPAAHYLAGVALLETGDAAQAEARFEESLRLGLASCQAYANLSRALEAQGKQAAAAERRGQADACRAALLRPR